TQLEGIEELIEDGVSGLLIRPGDATGLAAKLELLLKDSELRRRVSARGRVVIEQRFDRRTNFAQLKGLLLAASADRAPEAAQPKPALADIYDANCVR